MKRMSFKVTIKNIDYEINVEAVNETKGLEVVWDTIRQNIKVEKTSEVEIPQSKLMQVWNKIACL